jgi:hypothetical protein
VPYNISTDFSVGPPGPKTGYFWASPGYPKTPQNRASRGGGSGRPQNRPFPGVGGVPDKAQKPLLLGYSGKPSLGGCHKSALFGPKPHFWGTPPTQGGPKTAPKQASRGTPKDPQNRASGPPLFLRSILVNNWHRSLGGVWPPQGLPGPPPRGGPGWPTPPTQGGPGGPPPQVLGTPPGYPPQGPPRASQDPPLGPPGTPIQGTLPPGPGYPPWVPPLGPGYPPWVPPLGTPP